MIALAVFGADLSHLSPAKPAANTPAALLEPPRPQCFRAGIYLPSFASVELACGQHSIVASGKCSPGHERTTAVSPTACCLEKLSIFTLGVAGFSSGIFL